MNPETPKLIQEISEKCVETLVQRFGGLHEWPNSQKGLIQIIVENHLTELANPLLEKIEQQQEEIKQLGIKLNINDSSFQLCKDTRDLYQEKIEQLEKDKIALGEIRQKQVADLITHNNELIHQNQVYIGAMGVQKQQLSTLESQNKVLREALEKMIASAVPNPGNNPKMFTAWKYARQALSSTTQPQPQKITFNQAVDKVLQQEKQPQKEQRYNAAEVTKAASIMKMSENAHDIGLISGVLQGIALTPTLLPNQKEAIADARKAVDRIAQRNKQDALTANDDSELLDWLEKNKATVCWNNRCGAFIVQRKDQTVGHIGIGSTPSEAIRDAMKEGK